MALLRRLHRGNAALLGVFLALHLASHAFLVAGRGAHLGALGLVSPLYANGLVHPVLVVLLALQIGLGVALVVRRGRPDSGWAWAQVVSGLYLAFFLLQHVPAVIAARAQGVETDTFFAAAVLRWPLGLYFAPYYVLAVMALFTHVAAFLRFRAWPAAPGRLARALPVLGLGFGIVIVCGLMGLFGGPDFPETAQTVLTGAPQ